MTCLSYLGFRCFDPDITDDEIDGFIDRGEYALHQYSQSNFLHHIRGAWREAGLGGASEILGASTREFLQARWNPSRHVDSELPPGSTTLGHIPTMDPDDYKKLSIIASNLRARNLTESTKGLFFSGAHSLPIVKEKVSRHWPRAVTFDRHLPSYRGSFRFTGLEALLRKRASNLRFFASVLWSRTVLLSYPFLQPSRTRF